jgi:hypothetical protein
MRKAPRQNAKEKRYEKCVLKMRTTNATSKCNLQTKNRMKNATCKCDLQTKNRMRSTNKKTNEKRDLQMRPTNKKRERKTRPANATYKQKTE